MATRRRVLAAIGIVALVVPVVVFAASRRESGSADTRPADPTNPATPATVSADALPTVQIDGVVWSQAVVGDRVFAGGRFATARPPGSAVGVGAVARTNLLAYDITTGNLDTTFAPTLNAQVRTVATSPDGTRVYVGGDFTTVDGVARQRIAAFDTSTGRLVATFAPNVGYHVYAIVATDTTVYVGGNFQGVGTQVRGSLAAFRASDGALLDWAPSASGGLVSSLALSPDRTKIAVGGRFTSLNGSNNPGYGLAMVDATTGASLPMAANGVIRNGGNNAGITSLFSDADAVYGSGFTFGSGGTLEGTFRASWTDGSLEWVADCHGDTYSTFVQHGAVYAVGHPHYCGNIGGFQQTNPWSFHRALAFSSARTGTVTKEPFGYFNFEGNPAPSPLAWYPQIEAGTFTGQSQGPWHVTGDARYVVVGGEFPSVNGTPQQGLVRFAVSAIAPNQQVPRLFADGWPLRLTSLVAGQVQINWSGNWDRDNETLTYRLYREGTAQPIFETVASTQFWNLPTMGFTDTGRAPGAVHRYRVVAIDPHGNQAPSNWTSVTVATAGDAQYAQAVLQDGPIDYWRLGETSGTTAADAVGTRPMSLGGVTLNSPGAITGDTNSGATFAGTSSSRAGSAASRPGPTSAFTIEAWFRTTTTRGGKIVGYGSSQTGTSSTSDRHVYMDDAGHLIAGVGYGNVRSTVESPLRYNDDRWHHAVMTMGPDGLRLYVDGVEVASRTDATRSNEYVGFWRVGGDSLANWPSRPRSDWFAGRIDEVAIYHRALDAATVARHHVIGTTGAVPNRAPTAAVAASADGLTVGVDGTGSHDGDGAVVSYAWDFGDGALASGATASHTYATAGTFPVTLTVTDDDGATGVIVDHVTVAAPPPNRPPTASFTASVVDATVAVDASTSNDVDGTIGTIDWDFGDGSTATGPTASHTYAATGTYTVRLTVVDDDGESAVATRDVMVAVAGGIVPTAVDGFERSVTAGLGSADVGGAWATTGPATSFAVNAGTARVTLAAPGSGPNAYLTSVSSADTEVRVVVGFDTAATGNGTYLSVLGRRVGSADYRAKVRLLSNGTVQVIVGKLDGAETALANVVLPAFTYTPGQTLQVRFQATGQAPTALRVKVWPTGQAEPADWTLATSDSTAALQAPGHVGFAMFLSGSATNAPVSVLLDELWVGPTA